VQLMQPTRSMLSPLHPVCCCVCCCPHSLVLRQPRLGASRLALLRVCMRHQLLLAWRQQRPAGCLAHRHATKLAHHLAALPSGNGLQEEKLHVAVMNSTCRQQHLHAVAARVMPVLLLQTAVQSGAAYQPLQVPAVLVAHVQQLVCLWPVLLLVDQPLQNEGLQASLQGAV